MRGAVSPIPLRCRYWAAFFWVSSTKPTIISEIFSNYLKLVFINLIDILNINVD
jgi:hypothetical protein